MEGSQLRASYSGRITRPPGSPDNPTLADDTVLLDLTTCSGDESELQAKWGQAAGQSFEVSAVWMGNPVPADDLSISIQYGFPQLNLLLEIELVNLELAPDEMIEALLNAESLLLQAPFGDPGESPVLSVPVPKSHDDSLTEVLRLRRQER